MRELKNYKGDGENRYEGMSEEQLFDKLMRLFAAAKREGSFSDEELDGFVEFASEKLDGEAAARMRTLAEAIKRG